MARHPAAIVSAGWSGTSGVRRTRLADAACFGVPAFVLAGSWVWLILDHGTFRLWNVIVHESGTYTLGQTILYHAHFVRELPVAVAYALFALAAAPVMGGRATDERRRARSLGWLALGAAGALVAWALVGAANAHGWSTVVSDLLQFRTRDDTVEYGSHWRYHLLGTAWFGATLPLVMAFVRGQQRVRPWRGGRTMQTIAWGWVIMLTLVFGSSVLIFTDVRYAGHQAREIMTHGPVTMLLAIGSILVLARRHGVAPDVPETEQTGVTRLRVAAALLIPVWLAAVALTGNVMAAGQTEHGLAGLIAAHYFEHTLDYILVLLLVLGGLCLRASRDVPAGEEHGGGALARSESRG